MNSQIVVFSQVEKKYLTFSKLNFIFGHAESGKTQTLKKLEQVFLGKEKKYTVNGTQTVPGDFDVIAVSSDEGISNHIKMGAKSLLRHSLVEHEYSERFDESCAVLANGLKEMVGELQNYVDDFLPGVKLEVQGADEAMDFLLSNLTISLDSASSSRQKSLLFSLIGSISSKPMGRTIVLIDDFNNAFDEENTIAFLEKIKETDACFILTTKSPIPQFPMGGDCKVFCMRDGVILSLPPLDDLVSSALMDDGENRMTFEEYLLGQGYVPFSETYEKSLQAAMCDPLANIQRILTAKEPVISKERVPGKVTIVPRTQEEEKIYHKVFEILGIKETK